MSGNDLASGDMVKMVDQSIGDLAMDDLAMGGSGDLAADLRRTKLDQGGHDLLEPDLLQGDLLQPDLLQSDLKPPSRLGTACNPQNLSACGNLGLGCLTSFQTAVGDQVIVNGYCTLSCDKDDLCTPYGGVCRALGKSGNVCMPACDGQCGRFGYACCEYCDLASGGTCTPGYVCAPPAAPNFSACFLN